MRLTATGRAVGVACSLLVVAGFAAGDTTLAGLGLAGVALVAGAAVSVIEAPLLDVRRTAAPGEVERGAPVEVTLAFTGTGNRARPFTVIETVGGRRRSATMPPLRAGERTSLAYPLDTSRRGTIEAGPLVLRRADPFGLVVAERAIAGTCTVHVRPRRHRIGMLPSGRWRDLEGPTREVSKGTASFHQLRDYVPGDDLRHVHWRATARTGTLVVREHVDTTKPEVVVIVDNRRRAVDDTTFEELVDVAASVLHTAERAGFPTQLTFTADRAGGEGRDTVADGVPHIDRLTAAQPSDSGTLAGLAEAVRARGRSLVLVAGDLDADDLHLTATVARGFAPAYLVSVVADRRAPLIAPPGVIGVPVGSAAEFATRWQRS